MTHWVWEPYSTGQDVAFVTKLRGLDDDAQGQVLRGEPLNPVPRVVITAMEPGRFADVLGAFTGMLFVSQAVHKILEDVKGAHIQFVPASVRGAPTLGYSIVNVLDTLPAIDLERSKYEMFEGTTALSRIHRLRLRPIQGDAPPIFHPAEDRTMILLSGDLRQRLTEATDHPGVLIPAEKYRNEY